MRGDAAIAPQYFASWFTEMAWFELRRTCDMPLRPASEVINAFGANFAVIHCPVTFCYRSMQLRATRAMEHEIGHGRATLGIDDESQRV